MATISDLLLYVTHDDFGRIESGEKVEAVAVTGHRRIAGRHFDRLVIVQGTPPDQRRLILPYRGFYETTVTGDPFGPEPIKAMAFFLTDAGDLV